MEPGLAKKAVNFSAFLDAARPDYHVVHHKKLRLYSRLHLFKIDGARPGRRLLRRLTAPCNGPFCSGLFLFSPPTGVAEMNPWPVVAMPPVSAATVEGRAFAERDDQRGSKGSVALLFAVGAAPVGLGVGAGARRQQRIAGRRDARHQVHRGEKQGADRVVVLVRQHFHAQLTESDFRPVLRPRERAVGDIIARRGELCP